MSGKNPLGNGREPQSYEGINIVVPVGGWQLIKSVRAPTTNDKKYPIGSIWINTVTSTSYQLVTVPGIWTILGSAAGGDIQTLTGGSGGAILPTAGNITLAGTANQIATTGAGSTITWSLVGPYTPATYTAHGVLLGEGTSSIVATAAGTNGQVLVGSTGADPVFATLSSANSSVTYTTGAGTLALAVTQATTTQLGGGETATNAEAQAMSSTTVLLTPSNLASVNASSNITFSQSPILQSNATTGAAPTGSTGDVNLMLLEDGSMMQQFILGAGQTIIAPRMGTTGLLTSLDLTNAEGAEYNFGVNPNNKHQYTIGTSAAFYIELAVNGADIGGLDPFVVGFRKEQANQATFTSYTDFATIGARSTTAADVVVLQTDLNNAGEVITNTTDAWTDGQTKTFKVLVSAAGVVTYTINGLAPTVTAAFTFDNGDVVTPFIRHTFGAATPAAINWVSLKIGFQ